MDALTPALWRIRGQLVRNPALHQFQLASSEHGFNFIRRVRGSALWVLLLSRVGRGSPVPVVQMKQASVRSKDGNAVKVLILCCCLPVFILF